MLASSINQFVIGSTIAVGAVAALFLVVSIVRLMTPKDHRETVGNAAMGLIEYGFIALLIIVVLVGVGRGCSWSSSDDDPIEYRMRP